MLVFGGMRLSRPEADLAHRPPRERLILASLIAARGRTVSIGDLVDSLWGDAPPSTAVNQVQRHVGELRRLLQPELPPRATGTAVLGAGEGYRLDTAVVRSDLDLVAGLWEQARRREGADASSRYLEALGLAAGSPFSGLGWETLARPAFAAIERDRVALAIDAADCALELRNPSALTAAIERVATDAPLDERLQARLVTLLARSGRRADAIAVYDVARRRLWRELSIAPSAELQAAVDDVLSGDERDATGANVPRRLPLAPAAVVDRPGIRDLLEETTAAALRGEPAILAISGMAGIGKTTLAVQWAHAVADRFPDGQLFINLRGYAPPGEALSDTEALGQLLADLGGSVAGIQGGDAPLREAYRRAIGGRRMVLVIDNAADADQARSLLPGVPGCLVIITSRTHLLGMVVQDGAVPVPLRRLTDEESRRLLARRLGETRMQSDPASIDSIVASCGGLPLALALAAASAAGSREAMQEVADGLSAAASALDVLSLDADNDLRSTFEWSYRELSEDAARLFRLASVHPGVTHPRAALASIAEFDLARTSATLAELVGANMFVAVAKGEFAVHDLLRAYAHELAAGTDERVDAQRRLVGHYVHMTRRAYLAFGRPAVVDVESPAPVAEAITGFESSDDAVRWYLAERKAVLETFGVALQLGLDREAALIALDWRPIRQAVDAPSVMIDAIAQATEAAERCGDERLEVELRRDLAVNLGMSGDEAEAERHFELVLATYRAWGDHVGESNTLRNLGHIRADPSIRLALTRESVAAARRSGRSDILAISLVTHAYAVLVLGTTDELAALTAEAGQHVAASKSDYLAPYVAVYQAMVHARRREFAEALELVETTRDSLDVMVQAYRAMVTAIAAAGAGHRDQAYEASERFDRLVRDHEDFMTKDYETGILRPWIRDALAEMERRPAS
ncbi:NB-ARC domain-containing protein [Agromyces endophyticus]|uniref:AfsR/SARP family transcriptional regulator n=1 Tax=Agromyces sp. H17E-10 TaxID=2932244 RepID=UPI001FD00963|nr:BTAD domain-containing putative transcriptional regulator [Agromyces sp. H17E-10]UOQ87757.1 NB-ARC domain-containing protein [Agromyces sp. H17E-10]